MEKHILSHQLEATFKFFKYKNMTAHCRLTHGEKEVFLQLKQLLIIVYAYFPIHLCIVHHKLPVHKYRLFK